MFKIHELLNLFFDKALGRGKCRVKYPAIVQQQKRAGYIALYSEGHLYTTRLKLSPQALSSGVIVLIQAA
jgi:hypothetical protein